MNRAKAETLKGQFDKMKLKEGEDITKYSEIIKKCVSAIGDYGGKIKDEKMVSKVLINLLLSMQLDFSLFKR